MSPPIKHCAGRGWLSRPHEPGIWLQASLWFSLVLAQSRFDTWQIQPRFHKGQGGIAEDSAEQFPGKRKSSATDVSSPSNHGCHDVIRFGFAICVLSKPARARLSNLLCFLGP